MGAYDLKEGIFIVYFVLAETTRRIVSAIVKLNPIHPLASKGRIQTISLKYATGNLQAQIRSLRPKIRDTIKRIRKTTNSIFAIPAAVPAIPPKPKTAATNAMIRKITAHPNIVIHLLLEFYPILVVSQSLCQVN